jgi:hypothetical protein
MIPRRYGCTFGGHQARFNLGSDGTEDIFDFRVEIPRNFQCIGTAIWREKVCHLVSDSDPQHCTLVHHFDRKGYALAAADA